MKVAYLGGGTGGHLAPGIGVAEHLAHDGHEALFLVAGRDVERAMLEPRGLPARPLFGDRPRPAPADLPAWWAATRRLRAALASERPDVVVVLGGWVALPALWTRFGGRPTVLIESNARPGRVQRLLGGRVDHACLAVEGRDMPRGRRGTHVTGAPAPAWRLPPREEAARLLRLDASAHTLLLLGGSQGAADLDALVPALATELVRDGRRWQVLHVTGPGKRLPPSDELPVPVVRVPFLSDMGPAWALADVAVCRAGAGTVAELAATGTPAVLVPYPYHRDRHQAANGERLVAAGGARIVPPDDPQGRSAAALLARCLPELPAMSAAARRLARPDAARAVADVVRAAGGAS